MTRRNLFAVFGLLALVAALWIASGGSTTDSEAGIAPPSAWSSESTRKSSMAKAPASPGGELIPVMPARPPAPSLQSVDAVLPAGFVVGPDGRGHFQRKGAQVQVNGAQARISLPYADGGEGMRYGLGWGIEGGRAVMPTKGPELPGRVHQYLGDDAAQWRREVPVHASLGFDGVLPGARVITEPDPEGVRYALRFEQASQAQGLSLYYDGVTGLRVEESGRALVIQTPAGEVRESGLRAFEVQEDGRLRELHARYVALGQDASGRHRYGFELGAHRPDRPLVIDPTITWSTRVGGAPGDYVHRVAVHKGNGDVFLLGRTSAAAPIGTWVPIGTYGGAAADMFLAKIVSSGPDWFAYLGGFGNEIPGGLALDEANGQVFVYGTTSSALPQNVFGTSGNLPDALLATFDFNGQLKFGQYIGGNGSDEGVDVGLYGGQLVVLTNVGSLDMGGTKQACYSGTVSQTPTACGVDDGTKAPCMVYLSRLSPTTGVPQQHWSFLAQQTREAERLTVTPQGQAYFVGPVKDAPGQNNWDAYLAFVNLNVVSDCSVLTTFGESGDDYATSVAVADGRVFVGGHTTSSTMPHQLGSAPFNQGGKDAFLAYINGTDVQTVHFLGGTGDDEVTDLSFAPGNSFVLHFGGTTASATGIALNGMDSTLNGLTDGFFGELSFEGGTGLTTLTRASYVGGDGDDSVRAIAATAFDVILAGQSSSTNLPSTGTGTTPAGGGGFTMKVNLDNMGQADAGVIVEPGSPCELTSDCGGNMTCEGGFCCTETCAGGCQTCQSGTCQIKPVETICRLSEGTCDVEEICDGTSKDCPPDLFLPDGDVCETTGVCMEGVCQHEGLRAVFAAIPLSGEAPLTVTFDPSPTTFDPAALPLTYWWSFGDGSPPTDQERPSHTYAAPGGYQVDLLVRDAFGRESTYSVTVRVEKDGKVPPSARIIASTTSGSGELSVDFSCQCEAGSSPITSWRWELDDERVVFGESVSASFKPGAYHVQLEVTDREGLRARHQVEIRVKDGTREPPVCSAYAHPPAGEVPMEVKLMGDAYSPWQSGVRTRWEVNGGEYDQDHFGLSFTSGGIHEAVFTAEDDEGRECRAAVWITALQNGDVPPVIDGRPGDSATCLQAWTYGPGQVGPTTRTFGRVEWSVEGPVGMNIDTATGAMAWTPTPDQEGRHDVKVRARNAAGEHEQSFNVTVTCPELVYETGWGCTTAGGLAGAVVPLLLGGLGLLALRPSLRRRRGSLR